LSYCVVIDQPTSTTTLNCPPPLFPAPTTAKLASGRLWPKHQLHPRPKRRRQKRHPGLAHAWCVAGAPVLASRCWWNITNLGASPFRFLFFRPRRQPSQYRSRYKPGLDYQEGRRPGHHHCHSAQPWPRRLSPQHLRRHDYHSAYHQGPRKLVRCGQ